MAQHRRQRVIVNTDAKNEADDQFAIVHALLSPTLDVRGLVAAHFGDHRSAHSMADSRAEIDLLLDLLQLEGDVPVADGAEHQIPDEHTPVDSAGARLIIDEAHADADGRLYLAFLGPLTDMASALLLDPTIVERDLVVIWIGGHHYYDPTAPIEPKIEFNLGNDVAAANVVMRSSLTVWQVPSSTYRLVGVGYAELDARVAPHGRIGRYLVDQLREWNATHHSGPIEHRSLGDSPAIGLMLNPHSARFSERTAPVFAGDGTTTDVENPARTIRVVENYDTRWLLEDMFHKIAQHARQGEPVRSNGLPA